MDDQTKTQAQLIEELQAMRTEVAQLRGVVDDFRNAEETLFLLRSAIETADVGITISNKEGRIIYSNPADAAIHGYTVSELIGQPSNIFGLNKTRRPMSNHEVDSMAQWKREGLNMRKDGTVIPVLLISASARNVNGDVIGIVTICADISERKRAEQELQRSREFLNHILNSIPDPVFVKDSAHHWIMLNDAMCDYLGQPREALLDKSEDSFFSKEDTEAFWETDKKVFSTGLPSVTEERLTNAAAKTRIVATKKALLEHPSTHEKILVGIIRDITELKEKEAALHQYQNHLKEMVNARTSDLEKANDQLQAEISERTVAEKRLASEKERLSVTLKCLDEGVITTDTRGYIELFNMAAEAMTGWSHEEAIGRSSSDVFNAVDEESREAITPLAVLNIENKANVYKKGVLIAKDGSELAVAISTGALLRSSGEKIGVVITFRDVTEARQFDHAKKMFLNSISHELRTPLAPIRGFVELMQMDEEMSVETRREFLQHILTNVEREQKLVDELISLARLESRQEQYEFTVINAYEFFSMIEANNKMLVRQLIQDRYSTDKYTYISEINSKLKSFSIYVDTRRMQEVLESLLTNAIKYSPANRMFIQVSADCNDGQIQISVHDKGRGIPKLELSQIFKPFYQVRRKGWDVSDGIGLGLARARQYMEAHGGRIKVDSVVEQGSCFTVILPIHKQAN